MTAFNGYPDGRPIIALCAQQKNPLKNDFVCYQNIYGQRCKNGQNFGSISADCQSIRLKYIPQFIEHTQLLTKIQPLVSETSLSSSYIEIIEDSKDNLINMKQKIYTDILISGNDYRIHVYRTEGCIYKKSDNNYILPSEHTLTSIPSSILTFPPLWQLPCQKQKIILDTNDEITYSDVQSRGPIFIDINDKIYTCQKYWIPYIDKLPLSLYNEISLISYEYPLQNFININSYITEINLTVDKRTGTRYIVIGCEDGTVKMEICENYYPKHMMNIYDKSIININCLCISCIKYNNINKYYRKLGLCIIIWNLIYHILNGKLKILLNRYKYIKNLLNIEMIDIVDNDIDTIIETIKLCIKYKNIKYLDKKWFPPSKKMILEDINIINKQDIIRNTYNYRYDSQITSLQILSIEKNTQEIINQYLIDPTICYPEKYTIIYRDIDSDIQIGTKDDYNILQKQDIYLDNWKEQNKDSIIEYDDNEDEQYQQYQEDEQCEDELEDEILNIIDEKNDKNYHIDEVLQYDLLDKLLIQLLDQNCKSKCKMIWRLLQRRSVFGKLFIQELFYILDRLQCVDETSNNKKENIIVKQLKVLPKPVVYVMNQKDRVNAQINSTRIDDIHLLVCTSQGDIDFFCSIIKYKQSKRIMLRHKNTNDTAKNTTAKYGTTIQIQNTSSKDKKIYIDDTESILCTTILDINQDGKNELLVGQYDRYIVCYSQWDKLGYTVPLERDICEDEIYTSTTKVWNTITDQNTSLNRIINKYTTKCAKLFGESTPIKQYKNLECIQDYESCIKQEELFRIPTVGPVYNIQRLYPNYYWGGTEQQSQNINDKVSSLSPSLSFLSSKKDILNGFTTSTELHKRRQDVGHHLLVVTLFHLQVLEFNLEHYGKQVVDKVSLLRQIQGLESKLLQHTK